MMKSVNPATGDTMAIHEKMEEGAILKSVCRAA